MGKERLELKFLSSAKSFDDALLTGNGQTIILSTGGASSDNIRIIDSRIDCEYLESDIPNVSFIKNDIITQIQNKNYSFCENALSDSLLKNGYKIEKKNCNKFCDLLLKTGVVSSVSNYYRKLSMNSGEIETGFRDREGEVLRSYFVSRESGLICIKLQGLNGKNLEVEFSLKSNKKDNIFFKKDFIYFIENYFESKTDSRLQNIINTFKGGNGTKFIKNGIKNLNYKKNDLDFNYLYIFRKNDRITRKIKKDDENLKGGILKKFLKISKTIENVTKYFNSFRTLYTYKIKKDFCKKKKVNCSDFFKNIILKKNKEKESENCYKNFFGLMAKVLCFGGEMDKSEDSIFISQTSHIEIFLFPFFNGDICEGQKILNSNISYESLFKKHSLKHNSLMNTTSFNFFCKEKEYIEEELLDIKKGIVSLSLIEKLYNYGKFLFICSSNSLDFFSKNIFQNNFGEFDNFFETPRLVNFLFKSNLSTEIVYLFEKIIKNLPTYEILAKNLFDCNGCFVPPFQSKNGKPTFLNSSNLLNINTGAMFCILFYQYFLQTNDFEFLKKAYRFFVSVGEFYLSFFEKQKLTKVFVSPFSISPLSVCKNTGKKIASNCVIDFNCARQIFEILAVVSNIFNEDSLKWEDAFESVPNVEVDKNGVLKEYNCNSFVSNEESPYVAYLFPYNIGVKPNSYKKDFESLVSNSVKYRYLNSFGNLDGGNLIDGALSLFTCGEGVDGFKILFCLIKNFLGRNLLFYQNDVFNMGVGLLQVVKIIFFFLILYQILEQKDISMDLNSMQILLLILILI